jgi:hypothetical protein
MSIKTKITQSDSSLSKLNLPNSADTNTFLSFEKIPTTIYTDSDAASRAVANEIASIIKIKQLRKEKCLMPSLELY